ncbi:MAG: hypothetical protein GEU87_07195 [Alphaproteobacteria bacterium]|nr:hypothetical protein [Alphaproteobacteria bacterium]
MKPADSDFYAAAATEFEPAVAAKDLDKLPSEEQWQAHLDHVRLAWRTLGKTKQELVISAKDDRTVDAMALFIERANECAKDLVVASEILVEASKRLVVAIAAAAVKGPKMSDGDKRR